MVPWKQMWQDYVIALVSILFGFILLPQLVDTWRGKTILNLYTASLTTIGLYILGITFFTLNMMVSVIAEFFSGTIWLLLFLFSVKNIKKNIFQKINTE
jgi:hypothetical protein